MVKKKIKLKKKRLMKNENITEMAKEGSKEIKIYCSHFIV